MKKTASILLISFLCAFVFSPFLAQAAGEGSERMPWEMEALKDDLSHVRGVTKLKMGWPRTIEYEHQTYDFREDALYQRKRTAVIASKPLRIIPHAVGVTEILWAICPRERIIAFHESSANPEFCFIADLVEKKGPVFQSKQTELIIGYRPDLVFTVFYSGGPFKAKLRQAKIPYFDLGHFGTLASIKKQTLLIGDLIGEEGNAQALVSRIDEKIQGLRRKIPDTDKPVRVLCYNEGGYVPGESSSFESICHIIGVVNVGVEQGIKSWSQIDYETLLKWDPDIIVVPKRRDIKEQLMANEVLSHARAIKEGKVYEIPGRYLSVDSQYLVLSANLLAGIVYEGAF